MAVSQTTRFGVYRWSEDGDSFTRAQMDQSHEAIENKAALFLSGTTLPTPAAEYERSFFYKTDNQTLYIFRGNSSTGTWESVGQFGSTGQMSTLQYGQANSAGVINAAARIDHVHALPAVDLSPYVSRDVVDAKGDLLVGTSNNTIARFGVGGNGTFLTADSSTASGMKWSTVDLSSYVNVTAINARGDLLVGSQNDTITVLPAGAEGQALIADPNRTTGLKWSSSFTFQNYRERVNARGTISGTNILMGATFNIEEFRMGGNVSVALSAGGGSPSPSGFAYSLTLVATQDNVGNRILTFPASVRWPNGTRPSEDLGANKTNVWSLITFDNGTTWLGFLSGRGFS